MTRFETAFVKDTVEKTKFADTAAQNFFTEWCRINDSIVPQYMPREEWGKRGVTGILEKNEQGKQTLFIPEDLHLWEMVDIIRLVDHDTLARKPELRDLEADKVKQLGSVFKNAGLYLAEYLPAFEDGDGDAKQIAEDIAGQFYRYGLSLQQGEQINEEIPPGVILSPEEKVQMDEWFLGREAYHRRLSRFGDALPEDQKDAIRKRYLRVYFKALAREGGEKLSDKPWEKKTGPFKEFQDKAKIQITRAIETPERELMTTVFRRGKEKLVTEIKESGWRKTVNDLFKRAGFDPILEQRRLYDVLHIDQLKSELQAVRATGNIARISAKELEIAKKIQKAVSKYPYQDSANNPSEIVENQSINCVGISTIGGSLLDEVGIKYLFVNLPDHAATVLVTANGKAYWQDFMLPTGSFLNYKEITDRDIVHGDESEKSITVSDIVKFAQYQRDERLNIVLGKTWNNTLMKRLFNGDQRRRIKLFNRKEGLQSSILNNAGNVLRSQERGYEALEAYREAIRIDPQYVHSYNGLGSLLARLGKPEEAIEIFRKAIQIDPYFPLPYSNLGNALNQSGQPNKALQALEKFLTLETSDSELRRNVLKLVEKLKAE